MHIPSIAFFDSKPYDIEAFGEQLPADWKVKFLQGHLTADTVSLASGYNTVCVFVNDQLTAEVIQSLVDLDIRLIALRCSGYNNVDLKAAYKRIHTVRVPAYSPYAVAEHAVGMMLALNRKIHRAYYRIREGNFNINGLLGFDLHRKTAGIIGTGKIGRILAGILKGFGMRVLAYDAYPDEAFAEGCGCEYVTLESLYEQSDVISLHCPLTPATYHLISDEALGHMKSNVMLINTSRGQLIDTQALINALKERRIGYAGLDVYEEEADYFFEDLSNAYIADDVLARLLTFNNVLVTSHQAFFTQEALSNIATTTVNNVRDFFKGDALPNEICYHCGEQECRKETTGTCF